MIESPRSPCPPESMTGQGRGKLEGQVSIFRCFLATESVKGINLLTLNIVNNGSFLEAGMV